MSEMCQRWVGQNYQQMLVPPDLGQYHYGFVNSVKHTVKYSVKHSVKY